MISKLRPFEFLAVCNVRAIARSENMGGGLLYWVGIMCPLVEIVLTYLTKTGGNVPPPGLPLATGLNVVTLRMEIVSVSMSNPQRLYNDFVCC